MTFLTIARRRPKRTGVPDMSIKYPNVTVKLTGTDGNAFAIMSKVTAALRKAGVEKPELDAFFKQATSGNYDNLLNTCMEWVDVR